MRVHLHRACVDNAGRFVDAGNDIDVGAEPEQLAPAQAEQLLASGGAIDPDAPPEDDVLELSAEQHAHDAGVEHGVDEFGIENSGK